MALKLHKVVASLPGVLEADSVYVVRSGAGFDLYVTNAGGTVVAYPLNGGGGSSGTSTQVTLNFVSKRFAKSTFTVPGVIVGTPIFASASLEMPAGVAADELEMDPIIAAARVSAADTVEVMATATSPIIGPRNIAIRVG